MFTHLVKYSASTILLLALLSFTGIVSTAVAFTGNNSADICCSSDEGHNDESPFESEGCVDADCRCASCALSTLPSYSIQLVCFETPLPLSHISPLNSSSHISDIEYPPEVT